MSFFSRKQEISLEDFCRDIYDNFILNPKIGATEVGNVFPEIRAKGVRSQLLTFIFLLMPLSPFACSLLLHH